MKNSGFSFRRSAAICSFLVLALCCTISLGQSTVYEYQVPAGGYDGVGNLMSSFDSVNGTWTLQYDSLNRFMSGSSSTGPNQGYAMAEGYDSFGNRLSQNVAYNGSSTQQTITADYDGTSGSPCPHPGSNRLCFTSLNGVLPTDSTQGMDNGHDAAGNLLSDGVHYYKYDAEGRLCASYSTVGEGYTQYFYDAEGQRVAKGSSPTFNCPGSTAPTSGSITAKYLVGPSGEQVTELDGNDNWIHTNVYASGVLLASYSSAGLHFPLGDPLGTVRMEVLDTDLAAGKVDQQCTSLAFGDGQVCNGPDATEHHFTGKERDVESGLDYFGARYYASSMGRWTSPDEINLTEDRLMNPSNTLNKYAYGAQNPLKYSDPDGKDITIFYEPSNMVFAGSPGHTMLLAYDQSNNQSAIRSFGPDHYVPDYNFTHTLTGTPGTDSFGFETFKSPDDLRTKFSSITISTTPAEAEAVIAEIKKHPDGAYNLFSSNCTTTCSRILRSLGTTTSTARTPGGLFDDLFAQYIHRSPTGKAGDAGYQLGARYGFVRAGYNPYQLFFNDIPQHYKVTSTLIFKPLPPDA